MGDVLLDVAAGTPCQFRQDVAAVNVNHGQFVFLGDVTQRVVCSPNIEQLIRYDAGLQNVYRGSSFHQACNACTVELAHLQRQASVTCKSMHFPAETLEISLLHFELLLLACSLQLVPMTCSEEPVPDWPRAPRALAGHAASQDAKGKGRTNEAMVIKQELEDMDIDSQVSLVQSAYLPQLT